MMNMQIYTREFEAKAKASQRLRQQAAVEAYLHEQARDFMRNTRMPEWVRRIVAETTTKHGLYAMDILGPQRTYRITAARHEVFYLVKQAKAATSFPRIAGWFRRDHTSVMFGVAAHAKRHDLPNFTCFNIDAIRQRNAERSRRRLETIRAAKQAGDPR